MARPSKYDWAEIRRNYEAGRNRSEIMRLFGVPESSLSERIKKEEWKVSEVVSDFISKSCEISEVKASITQQDSEMARVASEIITDRTKHIQFFNDATMANINSMVGKIGTGTSIAEHRLAQDAILKGRETVLGKQPDTQVNIQNNVNSEGSDAKQRLLAGIIRPTSA